MQPSAPPTSALLSSSIDRLSNLLPELLSGIFELVRVANRSARMHGVISKNLLPYTDNYLYREVVITTSASLKLFVRTLVSSGETQSSGESAEDSHAMTNRAKHLASLVKLLNVNFKLYIEESWSSFDSDMVKLLESLANLNRLTFSWCPQLIGILTSDAAQRPRMKCLKELTLKGYVLQGFEVFDMKYLQNLRHFDQLETLNLLFFSREPEDIDARLETFNLSSQMPLPSGLSLLVRELKLEVDQDTVTDENLATFLSYFKNLETLSIKDWIVFLDFETVLAQVSTGLRHLTIDREDHTGEYNLFGKVLSRFPQLETLTLGYGTFVDETFEEIQHCMELKKLCLNNFRYYKSIPFQALHLLLRHPPNMLSEIYIDLPFPSKEGDDLSLLTSMPMAPYLHNWEIKDTRNNRAWSSDQVRTCIEAGSRVGVKICGEVADALYIQDKWEKGIAELKTRLEAEKM